MLIRSATVHDSPACAAIYAPYVRETVISLEAEAPTADEMSGRIEAALRAHAWLVAEIDGEVVGYAYGQPWKTRSAYRWTCEVSVYAARGHHRGGLGRALYTALFERLVQRGYLIAVAGMTLPNEASAGLHRAMGFESVGVNPAVGWKYGAWHDVGWVQRRLAAGRTPPDEPDV